MTKEHQQTGFEDMTPEEINVKIAEQIANNIARKQYPDAGFKGMSQDTIKAIRKAHKPGHQPKRTAY